jgi:hypothetical protein
MSGNRGRATGSTFRIEPAMRADPSSPAERARQTAALESLTTSAASNIPGVDFASITILGSDDTLHTVGATDPLANTTDQLQYELREGPCYAAVTEDRFVLINDLTVASAYPRYAPRAHELGVRAQAAVQLTSPGQRAGLNLYARTPEAFDRSTVQVAELFATHAAALLHYADQVEQLSEALHTRTDIGTAVGIIMERYGIGNHQAFAFLVRSSNTRNMKLRLVAQEVVDGRFGTTPDEDARSQQWP